VVHREERRTRNDADGMLGRHKSRPSASRIDFTDIYPQGSRSAKSRASNFVVLPGQMVHEQLASFSVPIKAEKGKPWIGRLILVDQFKKQYKTEKVTFQWAGGATAPH